MVWTASLGSTAGNRGKSAAVKVGASAARQTDARKRTQRARDNRFIKLTEHAKYDAMQAGGSKWKLLLGSSAGFPTCCIAVLPACGPPRKFVVAGVFEARRLEIGDTA